MEGDTLRALGRLLDELSIKWVLIGAVAANRYRRSPRLTQDIDLLLADTGASLAVLEEQLRRGGWTVRRADARGELLRIRHPDLGLADLLVAGTDYQQRAIDRAMVESLSDGTQVAVLSPEDVIVHKLISGRTQDIADIEAIIEAKVALDRAYIERWADFWDVTERWSSIREE